MVLNKLKLSSSEIIYYFGYNIDVILAYYIIPQKYEHKPADCWCNQGIVFIEYFYYEDGKYYIDTSGFYKNGNHICPSEDTFISRLTLRNHIDALTCIEYRIYLDSVNKLTLQKSMVLIDK